VSAGFGTKVKELDFERGNSKAAVKEPNSEPDNSKPALFAKSAKGAAPRTATPKRKRTSAARLTYNQGKRFAESVGHPPGHSGTANDPRGSWVSLRCYPILCDGASDDSRETK
jgi:hypothetical protein